MQQARIRNRTKHPPETVTLNVGPPQLFTQYVSRADGLLPRDAALPSAIRIPPAGMVEGLDASVAEHPEVKREKDRSRISVELYERGGEA